MPPIRRGRLPARACAGRGSPYGRHRRIGLRDATAPRGDDTAVQVPLAVPVPPAVPVPTVDPVPPVAPERGHTWGFSLTQRREGWKLEGWRTSLLKA